MIPATRSSCFVGKYARNFTAGFATGKRKGGIENYPDWAFVDEEKNRLTEKRYALNLLGHAVHDLAFGGSGIRLFQSLKKHRRYIWNWLKNIDSLDRKEIAAQKDTLTRFGL